MQGHGPLKSETVCLEMDGRCTNCVPNRREIVPEAEIRTDSHTVVVETRHPSDARGFVTASLRPIGPL